MEAGDDTPEAALEIMRQWQWLRCDPDGAPLEWSMELSLVINRLAMEGHARPSSAILELLCRGEVEAKGDYKWQKYQWRKSYYLEEMNAVLKPRQWKVLADSIAEEWRQLTSHDELRIEVDLEKLNLGKCPIYDWEFGQNRFSTALCPPDTETHDRNYFEESFSVWDISVWLRSGEPEHVDAAAPVAEGTSKGGRPAIADWEAAALEMAGSYYRGDFKPQTIADVCRKLASWLAGIDIYPSDSVLRTHAKVIFEAFQNWERE